MFSSVDSASISIIAFCILALISSILLALFRWFFLAAAFSSFCKFSSTRSSSFVINSFSSSTSGKSIGSFNFSLSFANSPSCFFIPSNSFCILSCASKTSPSLGSKSFWSFANNFNLLAICIVFCSI